MKKHAIVLMSVLAFVGFIGVSMVQAAGEEAARLKEAHKHLEEASRLIGSVGEGIGDHKMKAIEHTKAAQKELEDGVASFQKVDAAKNAAPAKK
jgi:hypothetical protein